jgi:7-cyano-7-deazaguanine reductase
MNRRTGKHLHYPITSVPRETKRLELGIRESPPFTGVDAWTAYELSWLNGKGKPDVAIGRLTFPFDSPSLVESKSLKLYLNSFNQARLSGIEEVEALLRQDLTRACGAAVDVAVARYHASSPVPGAELGGRSIDDLDVEIDEYSENPDFLFAVGPVVDETLTSCLLKTNCPITGQPDWASLQIHYRGPAIDGPGLLKYIISLRDHGDFAEHCVERIFVNILRRCGPEALTVYARYTRRGGIDINPFRTNEDRPAPPNVPTARQ